jgi:hypothetical protein
MQQYELLHSSRCEVCRQRRAEVAIPLHVVFLSGRKKGLANLPAEQLEPSPPKRELEAAKDDALNAISLGSKQLGSNNSDELNFETRHEPWR